VINLDHDSVAAGRSGMNDAASAGGVDFGSVSLGEIYAWMQRETTEKWIGAMAEARGHAGIAGKRHAQGHEGHERLEALGRRDVARDAHKRRVEHRRVRIKLGWNVGAADSAFAAGQNEPRWIESGLGDDRRIARGGTFSDAVDGGESLRLIALYPVERGIDERKARRGDRDCPRPSSHLPS
jgi:hypothetical protein